MESSLNTESRLSHKFSLCQLIDQQDSHQCEAIMGSIHEELGYGDLNQFLKSIIINLSQNASVDNLKKLKKTIQQKILISTSNNKLDVKQQLQDINGINDLMRLPLDVVRQSASFFNDADVFAFEKCCRMCYQIINNLSYLKQANNFNTFTVTPKILDQMARPKHNFFKYSKAKHLVFEVLQREFRGDHMTRFIQPFEIK